MTDTTEEFEIDIMREKAPPADSETERPAALEWLKRVQGRLDEMELPERPLTGGDLEQFIHAVKYLGGDVCFHGDLTAPNVMVLTHGYIGTIRVRTMVVGRSYLLAVAKTCELWQELRDNQAIVLL